MSPHPRHDRGRARAASIARLAALLLTALATLLIIGWILYGPAVERFARGKLDALGARLGHPVHAGRVVPEDLSARVFRVEDLRVGAPLIADIPLIRAWLAPHGFSPKRAWPERVFIEGPTLHVKGDGTLEGALRALMDLRPERQGDASPPDTPRRALPAVEITKGRLIDHAGGLEIKEGALTLDEDKLSGSVIITTPKLGRCQFEGSLSAIAVVCDKALRHPLPGGVFAVARALEIQREPVFSVRLRGLHLVMDEEEAGRLAHFSGLEADVYAERGRGDEPWTLEAELRLPGGGEVEAQGTVTRQRVSLSAALEGVALHTVHDSLKGLIDAKLSLELDVPEREARFEGTTLLKGAVIDHRALSDQSIGPIDLDLGGRLTASLGGDGGIHLALTDGLIRAGQLPLHFEATYDKLKHARVEARLWHQGWAKAKTVLSAVPEGLLPHLQPIGAKGKLKFKSHLLVDMSDLKATKLDVDLNLKRFEITSVNEEIDFEALRTVFTTRFEIQDPKDEDKIDLLTRECGPETDRWVPFEEIPPLLPLAIISQEDGGFYKHGGVSLFHLRGSLIRNLRDGRFVRGGSTLTMQLAKNLFLNRGKTLSRKLEEVILTWLLEEAFEKDELMTLYVNVVEFGPDIFGIREAADHYFSKAPIDLSPTEIAFLVRLLPGPRAYYKQFERKKLSRSWVRRVDRLLKLLVRRGHLSEEAYAEADPAALWEDQR